MATLRSLLFAVPVAYVSLLTLGDFWGHVPVPGTGTWPLWTPGWPL
jgi:hypothetical protein